MAGTWPDRVSINRLPEFRQPRTSRTSNIRQLREAGLAPGLYTCRVCATSIGFSAFSPWSCSPDRRPTAQTQCEPMCRLPHRECDVGHGSELERLRASASAGLGFLAALADTMSAATSVTAATPRPSRNSRRTRTCCPRPVPASPVNARESAEDLWRLPHGAVRVVPEEPALQAARRRRRSRADLLDMPRRSGVPICSRPASLSNQCSKCHGPGRPQERTGRAAEAQMLMNDVRAVRAQLNEAQSIIRRVKDKARAPGSRRCIARPKFR